MSNKNFEIINASVLQNAVTVNATAGAGGIKNGGTVLLSATNVASYATTTTEAEGIKYTVINTPNGQGMLENINEEGYNIKEGDPLLLVDMNSIPFGLETVSVSASLVTGSVPAVGASLIPTIEGNFVASGSTASAYTLFIDNIVVDEDKYYLCHVVLA